MEEIRRLRYEELDESQDLSAFAFQYDLPPEVKGKNRSEQVLDELRGCFIEGRLAAQMRLLPLEIWLQGKPIAMGGIASVATWPEYRRQGLVARLIVHALREMKAYGWSVSMLHPFSFGFYRKFGWELHVEYKKYELNRSQLPDIRDAKGRMKRLEDPLRSISLLSSVYEPYAARYNGMLRRNRGWWEHMLTGRKSGTAAVYYNEAGRPAGYLLYDVKNGEMRVKERVALDREAEKGIWNFIRNHDSMAERFTVDAPADDPLTFWLDDPRIRQETVPYFMARIVDVVPFFQSYTFRPTGTAEKLSVCLTDCHAEWNDGRFDIYVDEKGQVSRVEKKDGAEPDVGEIRCGIAALTSMLFGYIRPDKLLACGKIEGTPEDAERWDALIPDRIPYLTDFF